MITRNFKISTKGLFLFLFVTTFTLCNLRFPKSVFATTTTSYSGTEFFVGEENGADGGKMYDLDGDGKQDLVIAGDEAGTVVWYKQVNPTTWTEYTIVSGEDGPEDADVADLDNDGDNDIAFVTDDVGRVVIAVNSGDPTSTPWNKYTLSDETAPINVAITDVNGDNFKDIIFADRDGDEYAWLENPDGDVTNIAAWTKHVMISGAEVDGAYGVVLVDWDNDGDLDVLGDARVADSILWLEHPSDPTGSWSKHTIGTSDDPNHVTYGDIDNDGDRDVAVAAYAGGELAWFENTGSGNFTKHIVFELPLSVGIAVNDLDEDGQLEIIASQYFTTSKTATVRVFEPENGLNSTWIGYTVLDNLVSGDEIFIYDVDSDSTPEIFSTSNDRNFTAAKGRTFWIDLALTTTTTTTTNTNITSVVAAPSCGDQAPGTKAPWLYGAMPQDSTSVLLYFTEADNPVNKYVLEYGTKSGDYPYGVQDMGVNLRGQMTFLVKSLSPNTTYYFKVRGGNGCAVGNWSNEISVKTKSSQIFSSTIYGNLPADNNKNDENITVKVKQAEENGYHIKVKVFDNNSEPIAGAKVTLHSTPRETTTDKNGVAEFRNVEPGQHQVLIAYDDYNDEQSIDLIGDTKEFDLNFKIHKEDVLLSPIIMGVSGTMVLVIIVLVILLTRAKEKDKKR